MSTNYRRPPGAGLHETTVWASTPSIPCPWVSNSRTSLRQWRSRCTIDELKIHDEVPPSLDRRWSLTELFQRELDEGRVKRELVQGYLNDPNKLKFLQRPDDRTHATYGRRGVLGQFPPPEFDPSVPWNGTDPERQGFGQLRSLQARQFRGCSVHRRWPAGATAMES